MLGTSKQVKWAIDIRDRKIKQIEEHFQELDWFPSERLFVILEILNAQEDAAWWIDNQGVSFYTLILWAGNYLGLQLNNRDIVTRNSNLLEPFLIQSLTTCMPRSRVLNQKLEVLKANSFIPLWVLVIDNQEPMTLESEVVDWYVVKEKNTQSLEHPTFHLSYSKLEDTDSEPLRSLLTDNDGGWSQKRVQFLAIYRYPNGEFQVEAIRGELIAKFSILQMIKKEVD